MEKSGKSRTIKSNIKPDSFTITQAKTLLGRVHVIPKSDREWVVKSVSFEPKSRRFDTKRSAVGYARKIYRKGNSEIVVHDKSGQVVEKISAKDSFPPS